MSFLRAFDCACLEAARFGGTRAVLEHREAAHLQRGLAPLFKINGGHPNGPVEKPITPCRSGGALFRGHNR